MGEMWTHGQWEVKEGCEEEFLERIRGLVREVDAELGLQPPILLRDREDPHVFVTLAAWDDERDIQRLREYLLPRVASLSGVIERFRPATLDRVELGD